VEFVNEREILVNATQRSGHHAFIDWLLRNRSRHLFLNFVKSDNFFRRRFIEARPNLRFVNDLNLSLEREISGDFTHKELIVYNMENCFTREALQVFNSESKKARLGSSRREFFVVWLRDPFNNLASFCQLEQRERARSPAEDRRRLQLCSKLWLDHFEMFKTIVNNDKNQERPFVPVLYNQWLDDTELRGQLSGRFGISCDHDMSEIVRWDGGAPLCRIRRGR